MQKICALIIACFKQQYKCESLTELLSQDRGFYFNNLFAKVRHLHHQNSLIINSSVSENRHLLLILRSLREHAPELLSDPSVTVDLLSLVIKNIDKSLCQVSQDLILVTIDIALLLSEHIRDNPFVKENPVIDKDENLEDKMRR